MRIVNFKKLLFLLMLFIPVSIIAQVNVKGVVKDEFGDTLPGVNVMIKGTTTGTVTNLDGEFSLQASPQNVLEISFMGFETQEILVGNQTNVQITLLEATVMIDEVEVVAVGYGETRRKDLTGAIASANMSDILKTSVNDVSQALGGRIAGVQVSSQDGGLGNNFSITIRGAGSLTQSTEPLYVIDGFPLESNSMGSLNPKDIASIDVLKDASATAIYGSRGANGVVIITTKAGNAGKPRIEYSGNVIVSQNAKKQSLLSGYQFVELQRELSDLETFEKNYLQNGRTIETYKSEEEYDWQDLIYRSAITHNHYLSLSGKEGELQYAASGSYTDQQGIIVNSNLNKYIGRISLDQKLYDNKLRLRLISNASRTTRLGADPTGGATSVSNALMYSVWGYRPVSPTGSDLMEELYDDVIEMTEDYRFNPVLSAYNEYRKTTTDNLNVNFMAVYEIIKNLRLSVTGGYQLVNYTVEQFFNSKTKTGFYHPKNSQYKGPNAYYRQNNTERLLNENTLTYQFNKNGHNLNLLGGATFQKELPFMHEMTVEHITDERYWMSGFGKSSAVPVINSAGLGGNRLASFLSRVNYNYKSKYYLTASFRTDGSSKFAPENRWGYFPSASLAWGFSREDFLEDNKWLSDGKLRLGFGQTGNDRVSDFASRAQLYTSVNSFYAFDSQRHTAYYPSSMQNNSLKWETTEQYNVGLDLAFVRDRIRLNLDYYYKKTRDLLLQADLAASSGYASAMMNIGVLENKGLEISLETTNIQNKNFTWNTSFNISFNRNNITRLNDSQIAMTNSVYWDNKYRIMPAYISPIGQPAGMMYGFISEGTYKEGDFDISENSAGQKVYTPKEGVVAYSTTTRPGDAKYKDINNDGVINDLDKTIIGQGHPKAIGGLGNDLSYKNFDLNFFLQFNIGNNILNANRMIFENAHGRRHTNMFASYINRWSEDNPTSDIPRAQAAGSDQYSSFYVEDGSFLRLKSVALGYTLPTRLTNSLHIVAARISISAENLFVLTNYSGNDPEVSTRNTVLTPSFDWSPYPRSRDYSLSVNLTF